MANVISRRFFVRTAALSLAAVSAVGLASCGSDKGTGAAAPGQSADSRVYYPAEVQAAYKGSPAETPLFVAREKGFFSKYAIEVQVIPYPDDLEKVLKEKKETPFFFVSSAAILPQIADKLDLAFLSQVHTGNSSDSDDPYYGYLAANPDAYIDAELSGRIAQAIQDAAEWTQENREEAFRLVNDAGYLGKGKRLLGEEAQAAHDLFSKFDFGDQGHAAFDASLANQWTRLIETGAYSSYKTADDLCAAVTDYSL